MLESKSYAGYKTLRCLFLRPFLTVRKQAGQAAAMTKKSILLLNTDHAYYHYKPQLVPLQASEEAMI